MCLQDEVAFKQKQKDDQKAMEALKTKASGKGPLGKTRKAAMVYKMCTRPVKKKILIFFQLHLKEVFHCWKDGIFIKLDCLCQGFSTFCILKPTSDC